VVVMGEAKRQGRRWRQSSADLQRLLPYSVVPWSPVRRVIPAMTILVGDDDA